MKIHTKRLLIITDAYPSGRDYRGIFVQEQISKFHQAFKEIIVISPVARFPTFLLRVRWFREYIGYNQLPKNYVINNIFVYFPRFFSVPDCIDKFLHIRKHLFASTVMRTIRKYTISFDMIHAHFLSSAGYAGAKVKECYNVPLIVTGHGGDVYIGMSEENKNRDTRVIKSLLTADTIITTSKINYDILKKLPGIAPENITIIRNGYDKSKFFPMDRNNLRKDLGLPDDRFIVLSIGNLVEIKGHKYLIQAISKLSKENPDIYCIIIGKGNADILRKQISSLDLENHALIINGIPHDQVPRWLNACDLFVLPSLNEGSPTVIPEAWGCGKPVIASSVGGIPELFQDAHVGILIPPASSEKICDAIKESIRTQWNIDDILEHSRQFTWVRIAEQLLEIYTRLLVEGPKKH